MRRGRTRVESPSLARTGRLLVACPDKPGIVAAVTGFLYHRGANVTTLQEYSTDPEGGRFFMRVEFTVSTPTELDAGFEAAFEATVAGRYEMAWRLSRAAHRKRTVVLVSKHDHALLELLWRHARGELHADITAVISNHEDSAAHAAEFGVPFHHVPVDKGDKGPAEARILELLGDDTELVVLARYMQILSADFVRHFPSRIINIHHSFLPAFVGANPYHQAHVRGVKLIGATAHYVTADLDQGPIIEQDVTRVSHRHSPEELVRLGRSIEREVLARAVQWHLEDRVLVHDGKTVAFT
ncbi:MAG: formyltetrahydrofolate deformylase [Myxococcales bacterium]|nr:formyltetrahydrofolate deformylase [Myxococcales bacterium]